MSIVYEERLDLAYDRLLIPLGSTVIGNLTSREGSDLILGVLVGR